MNNSNQSKQVLLSVIGVAILVVAVVGVSFAFFSYVNTSTNANTVKTGTISFSSTITDFQLTNAFPISDEIGSNATQTEEGKVGVATVTISGATTYDDGIAFQVIAENVNVDSDIAPKVVITTPESITGVTNISRASALSSEGNTTLYSGTIAANQTLTNQEVCTIKVYYSDAQYWISDQTKEELLAYNLIPSNFAGRIVTQDEWNALAASNRTTVSFKIAVLATEGENLHTYLAS